MDAIGVIYQRIIKNKPMNIPKITILLDNGYHPNKIISALTKFYPNIMRKVKIQLSPKPSKKEKTEKGKSGFMPVAARWIIERSNAWMERWVQLHKGTYLDTFYHPQQISVRPLFFSF